MATQMFTLLLIDGCHYIDDGDANRVAVAVRERRDSVDVVAHITAIPNVTRRTRVATKDVLKLIAHDVARDDAKPHAVSLSAFRGKRAGRSGSTIPFATR